MAKASKAMKQAEAEQIREFRSKSLVDKFKEINKN